MHPTGQTKLETFCSFLGGATDSATARAFVKELTYIIEVRALLNDHVLKLKLENF